MRRAVGLLLLGCTLAMLGGCGSVFIAANSGTGTLVVAGFVGDVQLATVPAAGGSFVQVTIVILNDNGAVNRVAFCGNALSRFPMSGFVTVNYTPAQPCGTIVAIHVS